VAVVKGQEVELRSWSLYNESLECDVEDKCYDLANWLSHYLYFFSFLFSLDLQLQDRAQKSIM